MIKIKEKEIFNPFWLVIFHKLVLLGLNYIKYLPLTFVFCDIFVIVLVVVVGTSMERPFFQFFTSVIGFSGSDGQFSEKDIVVFFLKLNVVLSILAEVVKRIFKIRISLRIQLIFVIFLMLILHIFLAIFLKTIVVPVFFFLISIGSIFLHLFLSKLERKLSIGLFLG